MTKQAQLGVLYEVRFSAHSCDHVVLSDGAPLVAGVVMVASGTLERFNKDAERVSQIFDIANRMAIESVKRDSAGAAATMP